MEFGSRYVFNYKDSERNNSEEEFISDDEMDQGIRGTSERLSPEAVPRNPVSRLFNIGPSLVMGPVASLNIDNSDMYACDDLDENISVISNACDDLEENGSDSPESPKYSGSEPEYIPLTPEPNATNESPKYYGSEPEYIPSTPEPNATNDLSPNGATLNLEPSQFNISNVNPEDSSNENFLAQAESTNAVNSNPSPIPPKKEGTRSGILSIFNKLRRGRTMTRQATPDPQAAQGPPPVQPNKPKKQAAPKSKVHTWMKQGGLSGYGDTAASKLQKFRRADTNVVVVKFDQLQTQSTLVTEPFTECSECKALFSDLNKAKKDDGKTLWNCEFCDAQNATNGDLSIPGSDVTYIDSPAPSAVESMIPEAVVEDADDFMVIFCIDISGSMDCTQSQMFGRKRSYVSRLELVKKAAKEQIQDLLKDHPTRKVGLVTFETDVVVHGDASKSKPDKLSVNFYDWDAIKAVGSDYQELRPISSNHKALTKRIDNLKSAGVTALGPALLVSVSMASRIPRSQVIICTDGLANKGLGELNNDHGTEFYADIGDYAKNQGVGVSVITIKDTECRLAELGRVANRTGGQVMIVDPQHLKDKLTSVLSESLLATNVSVSLITHQSLYFRYEENPIHFRSDRDIGNVTAKTEKTFEFGIKNDDERFTQANIPFQLIIKYTDVQGARITRLMTYTMPVTADRNVAEQEMNMDVVSCHAAQQSSRWAVEGRYTDARKVAMMNQRLLFRRKGKKSGDEDVYKHYIDQVGTMEQYLNQAQQMEMRDLGCRLSDSDSDDDQQTKISKRTKRAKARRAKYSDHGAENLFSNCAYKSKSYFK